MIYVRPGITKSDFIDRVMSVEPCVFDGAQTLTVVMTDDVLESHCRFAIQLLEDTLAAPAVLHRKWDAMRKDIFGFYAQASIGVV